MQPQRNRDGHAPYGRVRALRHDYKIVARVVAFDCSAHPVQLQCRVHLQRESGKYLRRKAFTATDIVVETLCCVQVYQVVSNDKAKLHLDACNAFLDSQTAWRCCA